MASSENLENLQSLNVLGGEAISLNWCQEDIGEESLLALFCFCFCVYIQEFSPPPQPHVSGFWTMEKKKQKKTQLFAFLFLMNPENTKAVTIISKW